MHRQHVYESQTLLKSARQHFSSIVSSSGNRFGKTSLLVRFEVLRLLVNTLTADDKYSCIYRENLPEPIQMHLSLKVKSSFHFFVAFLKLTSSFEHLKKNKPLSLSISEIIDSEKRIHLNV